MASEAVGALRVDLEANTAQFNQKMREARNEVGRTASSWSKTTKRASNEVSSSTRQMATKSTKALDGVSASISATGAAFSAAGSQIGSQIASVSGGVAGLTAGLGPVGAAILAVTSIVAAAVTTWKYWNAENDRAVEGARRLASASERYKAIREAADGLRSRDAAAAAGTTEQIMEARKELERLERVRQGLDNAAMNTRNRNAGQGALMDFIRDDEGAVQDIEFQASTVADRIEALQEHITKLEGEERRKRAAAAAEEQKRQDAAAAAEKARLDAMEKARKEADARREAQIRERDERLFDQADEFDAQTADLQLSAYERERRALVRERDQRVNALRERGEDSLATENFYNAKLDQLAEQHRLDQAAAQQDENDRAAAEQKIAKDAELSIRQDLADEVLELQDQLAFDLAQLGRSETEQRVEEAKRQYSALIERARQHGVDVVELEKLIQDRIAQIRQEGAEKRAAAEERPTPKAADPESFGDGFERGLYETIASDLRYVGQTGSDVAAGLVRDFSEAFGEFSVGVRRNKQEYAAYAKQFIAQTIAMIAQQAILRAIMGALSAGASEAVNPALAASRLGAAVGGVSLPGAALGGSFTVGGVGGPDSQLAMLRVSPGERIDVTAPGKSAGGNVIVNNYAGVEVQQRRSADRPQDTVIDLLVEDLNRDGKSAQALRRKFGLVPTGRRV